MNPRSLAFASIVMLASLSGAAAQAPSPSADPSTTPRPSSPAAPPAAANPDPTGASKAPTTLGSSMRQINVDELEGMDVLGADGKKIAEIERVVERTADKKQFVVVERGGFLGIGGKEIAIPLENIAVQGEKATLGNLDAALLDALPEYKNDTSAYRELDDNQQVSIPSSSSTLHTSPPSHNPMVGPPVAPVSPSRRSGEQDARKRSEGHEHKNPVQCEEQVCRCAAGASGPDSPRVGVSSGPSPKAPAPWI